LNDRLSELRGRRTSSQICSQHRALVCHPVDGIADSFGRVLHVQILEHEKTAEEDRQRIGFVFAGNVLSTPVNSFEDRVFLSDIGTGDKSQSAHQSRTQIGNDVAIEIG